MSHQVYNHSSWILKKPTGEAKMGGFTNWDTGLEAMAHLSFSMGQQCGRYVRFMVNSRWFMVDNNDGYVM